MATQSPPRPLVSIRRQRRVCMYCGYAGLRIQGSGELTRFRCPCCQGDLYARPARSYLEMEGFIEPGPAGPLVVAGWRRLALALLRLTIRLRSLLGAPAHTGAEPATPGSPRTSRLHDRRSAPARRRAGTHEDHPF